MYGVSEFGRRKDTFSLTPRLPRALHPAKNDTNIKTPFRDTPTADVVGANVKNPETHLSRGSETNRFSTFFPTNLRTQTDG